MKLLLILIVTTFSFLFTNAQYILSEDPVIVKKGDSLVNLNFQIQNKDSTKYDVSITDLLSGTAKPVKDYMFSPLHITNVVDTGSFNIVVKGKELQTTNKIIHLKITAKSPDTSFSMLIRIIEFFDTTNRWAKFPDATNTPKFEFVSYTDFKGYEQDQPNGIAQSQFLFKLPINPYYRLNINGKTGIQWFRSFILPDFIFNRIDKTDQAPSLQPTYSKYQDSLVVSPVINTFDFIKYSNFIFNSKLVVLSIFRPKSRIQFQISGSLYKIKVDSANIVKSSLGLDSLTTTDTSRTALSPVWATGFGAEIYYDTHFTNSEFPFNFRFIFGGSIIKNRSSEYQQADIGYTTPDRTRSTALFIGKTKKLSAPIWNISAMITKNLDLSKSKDNTSDNHYLFFRFNYSWQSFKGKVLTSKQPVAYSTKQLINNFSQFQLGLDLNFDGFFK